MNMINLTIDGVKVSVPQGSTVLEAAKSAGIYIPTLCYLKDINEIGACRMCLVEIGRARPCRQLRHAGKRRYGSKNQYPQAARGAQSESGIAPFQP